MHKTNVLLLIFLTLLIFSISLKNGFVGDDEDLFIKNNYYKSISNISSLFKKGYISRSNDYFLREEMLNDSGAVSYRPVVSASFFLDRWFWGEKPAGYHLHSELLHVSNVLLVYFIIFMIIGKADVAFLTALLFGLHPIQVEAVCSIAYRHDLLATLFSLISFLSFLSYHKYYDKKKSVILIFMSVFTYFLAVFAKESAIILPFIILLYDFTFFYRGTLAEKVWIQKKIYLAYGIVALFYLYVYVFVFPNSAVSGNTLMGGNITTHIASIFRILFSYFNVVIFPMTIHVLPPLYYPKTGSLWYFDIVLSVILCFIFFLVFIKSYKKSRILFFFLGWIAISVIPIINIMPLANPMAHRFLYLPSVGIMAVLSLALIKLCAVAREKHRYSFLGSFLKWSFVVCCAVMSIILIITWHNNNTLSHEWIKYYPNDKKAYTIAGIEYYKIGNCEKAKKLFEKSLVLGDADPRIHFMIGMCSLKNFNVAKNHFMIAIKTFPDYADAYRGLGDAYFMSGKNSLAIDNFKKALKIEKSYAGYHDIIIALLKLRRYDDANKILVDAENNIKNDKRLSALRKFVALTIGRK